MIHLHIVAEGATEEAFIRDVLMPHLSHHDVFVHYQLTHGSSKGGVGNPPKYKSIKKALEKWVRSDRARHSVYYTTMVDLYAFPKDEHSPYSETIQQINDKYERVRKLEKAMEADLNYEQFIAYVQLHEFETFLLVDPEKLGTLFPNRETSIRRLKKEIGEQDFELINDTAQGAPSKRISKYIPDYENQKRTAGPLIATDIGLPKLREKCPHFNEWLTRLEGLGKLKTQ